ncbi:uncharacterized protein K02A2.6-like [Frankliniella occidentalis]|uniref:Uncharacterized protein K02A2.6-like n=1 Tax=Frankliniella occidentalis TaxID=133901 RepID=A0A6J1T729_FRAOC|nr:uncharacterized protein K02A2.6-like [Frankliniella occidentalis]
MLARSSVWWPSVNEDFESRCQLCQPCSLVNFKRSHDYVPWPEAKEPMQRVHVDFYTFKGIHFFLFADSFSKWIHVQRMVRTTAADVISVLSTIFAIWGDPQTLESDNGPPFDSFDLIDFCTARDIILTHSPAYHPESNGFAQRSVQIAKKSIENMFLEFQAIDPTHLQVFPIDVCDKLVNKFLSTYRNTPTTTTLRSPNDVLLNFKPNSSLSRVLPKVLKSNVQKFRDGEAVLVKLQKRSPPIKGYVVRSLGPIRYLASFEGVIRGPHTNQMERCLH